MGREEDEHKLLELMKLSFQSQGDGSIAICGTPGCGKTTLTKFMCHRINNGKYEDIDFVADRVDIDRYAPKRRGSSKRRLSASQYISFFSLFEAMLRKHAGVIVDELKTNISQNRNYDRFRAMEVNDGVEDFDEIMQLIIEDLLPIGDSVKKKLLIFCDNIDFIDPADQYLFVGIFGTLSADNNNIRCVFTARPVSTALIRYTFRNVLTQDISDVYHLKDLDVRTVVNARLNRVDWRLENVATESAIDIIRSLGCGNLDFCLNIAKCLYLERDTSLYLDTPQNMLAFLESRSLIPDIFVRLFKEAKVPYLYTVLLSLPDTTLIDQRYWKKFNKLVKKIRNDMIEPIKYERLKDVLYDCVEAYLIRRVKIADLESAKKIYEKREEMDHSYCALTERGMTLIHYAKFLSELSPNFMPYPTSVRDNVLQRNTSAHKFTPENSNLTCDLLRK